jgi:hypothetical protein
MTVRYVIPREKLALILPVNHNHISGQRTMIQLSTYVDLYRDVAIWCRDSLAAPVRCVFDASTQRHILLFAAESDAVAFKMRWF